MLLKTVLFVLCINALISSNLADVQNTIGLDEDDLRDRCAYELDEDNLQSSHFLEGFFVNKGYVEFDI